MVKERESPMKILSRFFLRPQRTSPKEVFQYVEDFTESNCKYLLDRDMKLFLMPIDIPAYGEAKSYVQAHPQFYPEGLFEFFENTFTKKEMEEAKAYWMQFDNMCCGYSDATSMDYFHSCCEEGNMPVKQFKDYEIPPSEWRKRDVVHSSMYLYFVSQRVKEAVEAAHCSNVTFRPAWSRRNHEQPIAYQLGTNHDLPPLAALNNWEDYESCKSCKIRSYSPHFKGQLRITQEAYDQLNDFNSTVERFTELLVPKIIVSKKVYELFKSLGIKQMCFEPVQIG